jgi:cytochrome P450
VTLTEPDLYYDMYDRDIYRSPYELFRRMRNESPVYYNEKLDFYALTKHDDLFEVLRDRDTYISGKGMVYNIINKGYPMAPGMFINEDPPQHTMHRAIVSRLFTPRAVSGLEPQIRLLCDEIVDDLVGRDHFDFMKDFSLRLPIQVIGMLVGVPKQDHADLLAIFQKGLHEDTANTNYEESAASSLLEAAVWFNDYLDWREQHPTDDVMTQLLQFEFEDDTGTTRTLRRDEIVTYLTLITSAGSDTTATGISWAGSLLSDHPDQRAELVADPGLIPQAFEEVLRCEPPSYHFCRWSTKDVELHGTTIPAESVVVVIPGAANRDEDKWDDAERFDIHRAPSTIFTFSFGPHYCLGANLARLEAKIALETLLPRIPEWTVDYDNVVFTKGIDTRGYEELPVSVP